MRTGSRSDWQVKHPRQLKPCEPNEATNVTMPRSGSTGNTALRLYQGSIKALLGAIKALIKKHIAIYVSSYPYNCVCIGSFKTSLSRLY